MDYPHIKKHFGEERLKKEIEFIERGAWLNPERDNWMGNYFLKIIDYLIGKNELVTNFDRWLKEARGSKDLKDCLFELICIDELSKNNKLIIKQKNGDKIPDAFLEDEKIYIEMTNIEDIPDSIELKVNDICNKSQGKFKSSLGIHLIGINGFFEYNDEEDGMVPKKELKQFVTDLREKMQKLDKNILCFLLVHNYFAYHPSIRQFRLYRQIPYRILNSVADWDLLRKIVGDFKIVQKE